MSACRKILLIHYNQRWFYVWVYCATTKKRELFVLDKTHTYLYHKCHIDKVMCVVFTAYGYESSAENGGEGVKLGFYLVQGAIVAKKQVKESRRDDNGSISFDEDIIQEKGDAYIIDFNVNRSD